VQTFKVGPDYLDPTYLAMLSGRPCYNLDGWMTNSEYIRKLFLRATAGADIAVIEGVMGLFDGADPVSLDGSTAQIAEWLDAPVLLVVNANGMAGSIAAMVHGYATFDPHIKVEGAIANHCGSSGHAEWLRASVESASSVRMLGAVMQGNLPQLSSRHLGLVSASPDAVSSDLSDRFVEALDKALDVDGIVRMAQAAVPLRSDVQSKIIHPPICRLGIAYDEAFHFYYPDNLEALEQAGCELVKFSPLKDSALPDRLDGLYLGGGYPEEFAAALSANTSMLEQIRNFKGKIYAECGGLMYLAEGIENTVGECYRQVGLLPAWVRMNQQLKVLRYVEVSLTRPALWGEPGAVLRGHEYHYSELLSQPAWNTAYAVKHRRSGESISEGFQHENVLASYIHLHFASHPEAIASFVRHLSQ
jgi:cobyrinic acid a,c-diamide synthase